MKVPNVCRGEGCIATVGAGSKTGLCAACRARGWREQRSRLARTVYRDRLLAVRASIVTSIAAIDAALKLVGDPPVDDPKGGQS